MPNIEDVTIIGRDGSKRRARKGEALADGETMHFSMQFMDEQTHEFADAATGHRPGFLYARDHSAADAAKAEYAQRSKRMSNAWRTKHPDEGDLPAPGEAEAAWLRRQALAHKAAASSMGTDAASVAYEERSKRMRDAWKQHHD
jgi:hypothetical protein